MFSVILFHMEGLHFGVGWEQCSKKFCNSVCLFFFSWLWSKYLIFLPAKSSILDLYLILLLLEEWNLTKSSPWLLSSSPWCFFIRSGLSFHESVPVLRLWGVENVAQTSLLPLNLGLTPVVHRQEGEGVSLWPQTPDPTAPITPTMAKMTERPGLLSSSIGHVSAMAISQDTTVGPVVLGGEELHATRKLS